MQQKLQQFNKLLNNHNMPEVINFIKDAIKNNEQVELKKILTLTRYGGRWLSNNIVEYAIMSQSHALFDLLEENSYLVPERFFKTTKGLSAVPIIDFAVECKNHYVVRSLIKHSLAVMDIAQMLFLASTNVDKTMLRLLINHGATDYKKAHNDIIFNPPLDLEPHKKVVKKFHDNLFCLFAASRFDPKSDVAELSTDCITIIHNLGF